MRFFRKMATKTIDDCKMALSTTQNRLVVGVIVLAAGVGIGGGLIASAYIKLPE